MHGRHDGAVVRPPVGGGAAADAQQPFLPARHRGGHRALLHHRGLRLRLHHVLLHGNRHGPVG